MSDKTAEDDIDFIINLHQNWKGALLKDIRKIILDADGSIYEEVKWRMKSRPEGLAVWLSNGIVCRLEIFKNDVKLVFSKGALLTDSKKQFNARLDSATERAIEYREGYRINEPTLRELVQSACRLNAETKK